SPEPAELARSTGTWIRTVPVNVCGGGVALLRRQRASRLLFYSDVGGEWPDTAIRWRCADGGGSTRRGLSSASVYGRQLHATRSRASVWHAQIETGRSNRASGSRGASACVEDHPKCRGVSRAANLRRGIVVLQRMPICQS